MSWIAITDAANTDQPKYFAQRTGTDDEYVFCFPGRYSPQFRNQLEMAGFRQAQEGLVAPLTYAVADALRKIDSIVVVDKAPPAFVSQMPPLPAALQEMADHYPKMASQLRIAQTLLAATDWEGFSDREPALAEEIATGFSDLARENLIKAGWAPAGEQEWPLYKNGISFTVEQASPSSLPIFQLEYAGKIRRAKQTPELPIAVIIDFANRYSKAVLFSNAFEPLAVSEDEEPARPTAIENQRTPHGTAHSEPARLSLVGNAPDLSDGQQSGERSGNVSGGKRGSPATASGQDDTGHAASGEATPGHESGPSTGTAATDRLSVGGNPGQRDPDAVEAKRTGLGMDGTNSRSSSDDGRIELEAIPETSPRNQRNYHISSNDIAAPTGTVSRARANIEAIRLVKQLQEENREATQEEKHVLNRFSGWGSLAQEVFHPRYATLAFYEAERGQNFLQGADAEDYAKWKEKYGTALHPACGGLMSEQEWKAAAESTLNSHYTSGEVIQAMWGMAERLGFRGGRVVEPSAGTGLFLGFMPEQLAARSDLVGVELDSLTGAILAKLYPDADIQITGFEDARRISDHSADLVISNVPFGNYQVFDRRRPEYSSQSIHNYFVSRAIDSTRPGGLVAVITSHYTLDAVTNGKNREEWAKKADFVGAVRLPDTAFKQNAGTEVTTDILLFRKKNATPFTGEAFRHVVEVPVQDEEAAVVNEYFIKHPEMVLGSHSLTGSMYGKGMYTVTPSASETLAEGLRRVTALLPVNVLSGEQALQEQTAFKKADESEREGTLVEQNGTIFLVEDGNLVPPEWAGSAKKTAQALDYVALKQTLRHLINTMNTVDDEEPVPLLQNKLNTLYDTYIKKYGPVTPDRKNAFLTDDIDYPNVAALENLKSEEMEQIIDSGPLKGTTRRIVNKKIEKADIFSKRTIFPFKMPDKADSLEDAVKISRVYLNRIDFPYIAHLAGTTPDAAREALLESRTVFIDPATGLAEPRDIYLTGNVRDKLQKAETAVQDDGKYQHNVEALVEVQPPRKLIDQISVRLGTSWVPCETVNQFLKTLGVHTPSVVQTRIEGEDGSTAWEVGGYLSADARNRWGVEGATLLDLVQDALNLKRTRVTVTIDENGHEKKIEDKEKTLAAQEKQRELQQAFQSFTRENDEVAAKIEDIYNDRFNGHVVRTFEEPGIRHYPGASTTVELRPNQKTAVSRALQESTLLAHGVGTGKTFELITLAMEMRRLKTANKPWIVVQGSTIAQFASAFKRLYPNARILVPSEKQRTATNRKRLLAQIATGDWDAVITPHSFFNNISISPETEKAFIDEQLAEMERLMLETSQKSGEGSRLTVKSIKKKIKSLEGRLEKLGDIKRDVNIFFEDLGIDALLIDEAHTYKRGSFYTKMDNVKGLDRDASQRSMQLLMKSRHVQAKTNGKNVILATGTPISNTLTELWTLFRYIRPDLLREFHVTQFDDFASTFAETSVALEETATGDFKMIERFNTYTNGQALLTMWRSGADIALAENMNYLKSLPRLAGGKLQEISVERSEALTNYIRALKAERDRWDNLTGLEKRKNSSVPLEIYGKARRSAIDLRLIDSTLPDIPDSKANKAVENILNIWRENGDTRAAQLVFCDSFQSSDKKFNLFKEIKEKLLAGGVPEREIAIIHDFQTDKARNELFDRVNRGDVRVLMGTTERLGVGVNAQERLLAVHHIDAPLRPMDFEQRNGRIRRPGNMFPEVNILTYGTKNTLDSVIFQQLISKQKFINQVLRGDIAEDSFENPFDDVQASFEDLMAAFSGNPLTKEKMKLQMELRRLQSLHSAYQSRLGQMRQNLRTRKVELEHAQHKLIEEDKKALYVSTSFPDDKIPDRKAVSEKIAVWLKNAESDLTKKLESIQRLPQWQIANQNDFYRSASLTLPGDLKLRINAAGRVFEKDGELFKIVETTFEATGTHVKVASEFSGAAGLLSRLEHSLKNERQSPERARERIGQLEADITSLQEELQKSFPQAQELETARQRMETVEKELAATVNEDLEAGKALETPEDTNSEPDELSLDELSVDEAHAETSAPHNAIAAEIAPSQGIALKIGESIGGSRADMAQPLGKKGKNSSAKQSFPAWHKGLVVMQSIEGSWGILNENTGQPAISRTFASEEEAEMMVPFAAIGRKHLVAQERQGSGYRIVRRLTDRKWVTLKGEFTTREDALHYMAVHARELLEMRTGYGEETLPSPENVYRKGKTHHSGNVQPDDFLTQFGFRGAEFGKWNNQEERQDILNHSYDALMDLAEILGVPPKALSLNGELAIAFGARGHGLSGAKAHYEFDYAVINLTKMNGAGSLAHEWMHAFDNYMARQDGKLPSEKETNKLGDLVYPTRNSKYAFASHGFKAANSGVRKEVREAYTTLFNAMFTRYESGPTDSSKAEQMVDKARGKLDSAIKNVRNHLASECTYRKRGRRAATQEELAQFDALAEQILHGNNFKLEWRNNTPSAPANAWRSGGQRYSNNLFDKLSAIVKSVRGKSGFAASRNGILDAVTSAMQYYKFYVDKLTSTQNGESARTFVSNYAAEARKLDSGRTTNYWETYHEMLARAFAAFVEDKAAASDLQTDFLVFGANNNQPVFRAMNIRPYPEKEERKEINKAFQSLFDTLEACQTEKGVALASLPSRRTEVSIAPEIAVRLVAQMQQKSNNAAPTVIVDTLNALPANLREEASRLPESPEALYDSQRGCVFLITDAISNADRLAEVWMHEQVVHHGLRALFSPQERTALFDGLWRDLGGKNNVHLMNIAKSYAISSFDPEHREQIVEEYVASLAEKKTMNALTGEEPSLWKRIVDSVGQSWEKLKVRLTGTSIPPSGEEQIENLLTRLGGHVFGASETDQKNATHVPDLKETPALKITDVCSSILQHASEDFALCPLSEDDERTAMIA